MSRFTRFSLLILAAAFSSASALAGPREVNVIRCTASEGAKMAYTIVEDLYEFSRSGKLSHGLVVHPADEPWDTPRPYSTYAMKVVGRKSTRSYPPTVATSYEARGGLPRFDVRFRDGSVYGYAVATLKSGRRDYRDPREVTKIVELSCTRTRERLPGPLTR